MVRLSAVLLAVVVFIIPTFFMASQSLFSTTADDLHSDDNFIGADKILSCLEWKALGNGRVLALEKATQERPGGSDLFIFCFTRMIGCLAVFVTNTDLPLSDIGHVAIMAGQHHRSDYLARCHYPCSVFLWLPNHSFPPRPMTPVLTTISSAQMTSRLAWSGHVLVVERAALERPGSADMVVFRFMAQLCTRGIIYTSWHKSSHFDSTFTKAK